MTNRDKKPYWIIKRWRPGDNRAISEKINPLAEGIPGKATTERKKQLANIVKTCLTHGKGKNILYTRSKHAIETPPNQPKIYLPSYAGTIDALVTHGLMKTDIAEATQDNRRCSHYYDYEPLLELFNGITPPEQKQHTVELRLPKGTNGISKRVPYDAITNKNLLRDYEREMEAYNNLLIQRPIKHPDVNEVTPMVYKRIFNGGKLSAKQGGRYYASHPAFYAPNSARDSTGNSPRENIEVRIKRKLTGTDANGNKVYEDTYAKMVEFDYRSLHINLLYLHSTGNVYSTEIYNPEGDFDGIDNDPYCLDLTQNKKQRSLIKACNMAVLGSGTPSTTLKGILQNAHDKAQKEDLERYEIEAMWEQMSYGHPSQYHAEFSSLLSEMGTSQQADEKIKDIVKRYKQFHSKVLGRYKINKTLPLTLQWIDSTLVSKVLKRFVTEEIPVFVWHDSFLAPYHTKFTKDELRAKLKTVATEELLALAHDKTVLGELDKHLKPERTSLEKRVKAIYKKDNFSASGIHNKLLDEGYTDSIHKVKRALTKIKKVEQAK